MVLIDFSLPAEFWKVHRSSFDKMLAFRDAYLSSYFGKDLDILDVGSAAVAEDSATYRAIFGAMWNYVGMDVTAGRNVDVVVRDPYCWAEIADASFDLVVSGQVFEHIEWPWLTILEIARVLKVNGLSVIAAPSAGAVHRYPLDCWRFYPDGLPALAKFAGLEVVECHTDRRYAYPECAQWGDVYAILRRPLRDTSEDRMWAQRRRQIQRAIGCTPEPCEDAMTPARISIIRTVHNLHAIEQRENVILAGLSAAQVKKTLLAEAIMRMYRIVRCPLDRLERP